MHSGAIHPQYTKQIAGPRPPNRRTPAGAAIFVGILLGALLLASHPIAIGIVGGAIWHGR